jgi:hypothetical protein
MPKLWNIGIDALIEAELEEKIDDKRILTKEIALKR